MLDVDAAICASANHSAQSARFVLGADVRIMGLTFRTDLNGKEGRITHEKNSQGRFGVCVAEESVWIRPENIELAKLDRITVARGSLMGNMAKHNMKKKDDNAPYGMAYACVICGAHRNLGDKCCGAYCGTRGEPLVPRRNVHDFPDADESEVEAFLLANLANMPTVQDAFSLGERVADDILTCLGAMDDDHFASYPRR